MTSKTINQWTTGGFFPDFVNFCSSNFSRARTAKIAGLALTLILIVGCGSQRNFNSVLEKLPDPALRTGAQPVRPVAPEPEPLPPPPPPMPAPAPQYPVSGVTVVIDPGHGGKDPGAMGRGISIYPEKTLTLSIAIQVGQNLRNRGVNVIYTRSDDRFIELDERANISNRNSAYLFVSIHIDSSNNRRATGATVYMSRSPGSKSRHVASCIASALRSSGIECRGVKQANYRVLSANDRPCVLVECGFISNYGEAQQLCNYGYQARIAAAIANGIADCIGQ
jgi:N-acetylmuramoyl-L-alanine amidase